MLPLFDKILLRKRSVVESVNDELKNICQVEHSRHRSVLNFLVNLIRVGGLHLPGEKAIHQYPPQDLAAATIFFEPIELTVDLKIGCAAKISRTPIGSRAFICTTSALIF